MNELINSAYWLCTDLMIDAARLLHISYFEANFFLFCVIYPLATVISAIFFLNRKIKCKSLITPHPNACRN